MSGTFPSFLGVGPNHGLKNDIRSRCNVRSMSMRTRRAWLGVPLALALALAFAGEPSLDFIHLTDTHVCDLHRAAAGLAAARDHFEPSAESLLSFFEAFSGEASRPYRPAFFLITGDLIDAFRFRGAGGEWVEGQVETFRRVAERSPAPLYLALGNHDIMELGLANGRPDPDESAAAEARAAWRASAPCFKGGTWYTFEKQVGATSYVFVVLDNSYTEDAMAKEQLAWLKRQAEQQGARAMILAMHVPLGEDAQSKSIKAALAPARVALVLAGHNHANVIDLVAVGRKAAVQVRTAAFGYGRSQWRRVRLFQERVEISSPGNPERVEKTVRLDSPAP